MTEFECDRGKEPGGRLVVEKRKGRVYHNYCENALLQRYGNRFNGTTACECGAKFSFCGLLLEEATKHIEAWAIGHEGHDPVSAENARRIRREMRDAATRG